MIKVWNDLLWNIGTRLCHQTLNYMNKCITVKEGLVYSHTLFSTYIEYTNKIKKFNHSYFKRYFKSMISG